MFETMRVTPLSAALGELIVEMRLVEDRWPAELERRCMQRALAEVHRDVSMLLMLLDGASPTAIGEQTSAAAHEAFIAALVLAVMVQRMVKRRRRLTPTGIATTSSGPTVPGPASSGRTPMMSGRSRSELPATDRAEAAAARLLDALDGFVQRADVALRRVMLDGEQMEQVSAQSLPA